MKIKMLTLQAGPQGVREAGQIYTVPDKEAKQLVDGGYAVEVKRAEEPERAVRVTTSRRGRLTEEPSKSEEEESEPGK